MVPFGLELAQMVLHESPRSLIYQQIVSLMTHLLTFYMTLGKAPFDKKRAASSARDFCLLYTKLGQRTGYQGVWVIKPKFHLFIELAEYQTSEIGDPSLFRAYMDEDFVGIIGKIVHSRGGAPVATTTPNNMIDKYRAL